MFKSNLVLCALWENRSLQIFLASFLMSAALQLIFFKIDPTLWLCYQNIPIAFCLACVARAGYRLYWLHIRVRMALSYVDSWSSSEASEYSITDSIPLSDTPPSALQSDASMQTSPVDCVFTPSWEEYLTSMNYTIEQQAEILVVMRKTLPPGVTLETNVPSQEMRSRLLLAWAIGGRDGFEVARKIVEDLNGLGETS